MPPVVWRPAAALVAGNSTAITTKPFSMPPVRWFSTPSPISVLRGPIFLTVR